MNGIFFQNYTEKNIMESANIEEKYGIHWEKKIKVNH